MHETHPAAGRPPRRGEALPPLKSTRLLDQLRERIRALHYSLRTEEAYVYWCRAFIRFHRLRHPAEMGGPEVEAFLTWLASERGVSVSTHRQALSALLFLYGKVLGVQLPWMDTIARPQPRRRLPVVLSAQEVAAVLALMEGRKTCVIACSHGWSAPSASARSAPRTSTSCTRCMRRRSSASARARPASPTSSA